MASIGSSCIRGKSLRKKLNNPQKRQTSTGGVCRSLYNENHSYNEWFSLYKKTRNLSVSGLGPRDWIRTSGLLNPIQARYQTSPHPDICFVSRLPEYISTPFQKKQALFFFFPKNFFRQKIRKTSPQSRVLRLRGLILILRAYKNRLRFRTGRAFPVLKSEKLPHESS